MWSARFRSASTGNCRTPATGRSRNDIDQLSSGWPCSSAWTPSHPRPRRGRNPDPPFARQSRNADPGLHPRPARAAIHLRTLPRRAHRNAAARRRPGRCRPGTWWTTDHGGGRDHHDGFPLNRARMAELLGFRDFLLNSYGCIASSDYTARRLRRHEGNGFNSGGLRRTWRSGRPSRSASCASRMALCRSVRSCRRSAIPFRSSICG